MSMLRTVVLKSEQGFWYYSSLSWDKGQVVQPVFKLQYCAFNNEELEKSFLDSTVHIIYAVFIPYISNSE